MTASTAEQAFTAAMERRHVPAHLHEGLALYLAHGIQPGSFLMAVLTNDLLGCIQRGDEDAVAGLSHIVRFLYNDAPAPAWGSPESVATWIVAMRGQRQTAHFRTEREQ